VSRRPGCGNGSPCIDVTFGATGVGAPGYWSSTTFAGDAGEAWLVFFDGVGPFQDPSKSGGNYVRAVRGGFGDICGPGECDTTTTTTTTTSTTTTTLECGGAVVVTDVNLAATPITLTGSGSFTLADVSIVELSMGDPSYVPGSVATFRITTADNFDADMQPQTAFI